MTQKPWRVNGNIKAIVNLPDGSRKEVNDGDPFAATCMALAKSVGLSKFSVFIDGKEVEASEAPTDFSTVDEVVLKKYDEGM